MPIKHNTNELVRVKEGHKEEQLIFGYSQLVRAVVVI